MTGMKRLGKWRLLTAASGVLLSLSVFQAKANVVGSDFQIFNPIPSGLDFVTVHSSRTLEKKTFNFGFFGNGATNALPYFESVTDDDFRTRSEYHDIIGTLDLNFAYGLFTDWELGLSYPVIFYEDVVTDRISGHFSTKGATEVRPYMKWRFWQATKNERSKGMAVVVSLNHNLVSNNVFLGDGAGDTINLEWAYSQEIGSGMFAVNLGRRWRSQGTNLDPYVPVMGDAWIYSLGYSLYFSDKDVKFISELYGSFPTESSDEVTQTQLSYAELLFALKYDYRANLSFLAGLGGEVLAGSATPDVRFFFGLNYSFSIGEEPKVEEVDVDETLLRMAIPEEEEFIDLEPEEEEEPEEEVKPKKPKPKPVVKKKKRRVKKRRPKQVFVVRNINFKTDSHLMVYGTVKPYLSKMSRYILKNKKKYSHVKVVGHTDSIGSRQYNKTLSRKRAHTVRHYLIKQGVPAKMLSIEGQGEGQPIADNSNYQGRKRNRRVEFLFY